MSEKKRMLNKYGMVILDRRMEMEKEIKLVTLIFVLLSTAATAMADEPQRRPPPGDAPPRALPAPASENDSLLRRAYLSKNRHILNFIREQERNSGRESLRDPNFRAALKSKLELLDSSEIDEWDTEARSCAICERNRAQFNESEVRRLRALLALTEQNQQFNSVQMRPLQMNMGEFGFQQQPGFGGNFFNTNGSMNQDIGGLFAQILGSLMGGDQRSQNYGAFGTGNDMFGFSKPKYSYGNQWQLRQGPPIAGAGGYGYRQAPAIAGSAVSSGYSYGYSQPPAIVGGNWSTGYSNITNSHYSLINANARTNAPAVVPPR